MLGQDLVRLTVGRDANDLRLHKKDWLSYSSTGTIKNEAYYACGGRVFVRQQGSQSLLKDYGNFLFEEHIDWFQSFDLIFLQMEWRTSPQKLEKVTSFWVNATLPHQKLFARTTTIGHTRAGASYNHSWDGGNMLPALAERPHHDPFRTPEELTWYFHQVDTHPSWRSIRLAQDRATKVYEAHGIDVIDIYFLAAMMWDRHRDPLHYCKVGPMEKWSQVVFNYLMRGHLRDYNSWASAFAKEVERLGGVKDATGASLEKKRAREQERLPLQPS